jgi:hypothetical protein
MWSHRDRRLDTMSNTTTSLPTTSQFDPVRFLNEWDTIEDAIGLLKSHGFNMRGTQEQYDDWRYICQRQPTADDLKYKLTPAATASEHLVGHGTDERPPLSTRLVVGRAYSLTPGQRDVLRERYGLTPTRTIIVTGYNTFEPVHPGVIRWVTIKSNMHVDDTRKHILISATIGDFGHFMATAEQRDRDRTLLKESGVTEDATNEVLSTKIKLPKIKELEAMYGLE